MIIHLSEKEAVKLLLLVRHYANTLQNSKLPSKPETIDFYENLYDNIGVQIESHKRQSEKSNNSLKKCLSSIYGQEEGVEDA